MSHITTLKIEGLAGSNQPFAVDLNRDINVIFGLNGSGKTSLLRILDSAFANDAGRIPDVPSPRPQ